MLNWNMTRLLTIAAGVVALTMPVSAQRMIEGRQSSVEPLVERAQVIAVASVVSSRSDMVRGSIVTFHELELEQSLLGRPARRFTIVVPGGSYGNLRTQWPGAPSLALNQRLVLFGEQAEGGASLLRPVGLFSGLIPVEADEINRAIVQMQGRAELVADFVAKVRQAVAARP